MSGRVSGVKNAHGHELRALRQEDKALESKPGCDVYRNMFGEAISAPSVLMGKPMSVAGE